MLDILDDAKSKLTALHRDLEIKVENLKDDARDETCRDGHSLAEKKEASTMSKSIPTPQPDPSQVPTASSTQPGIEVPNADFWQNVPLRLHFRVKDGGEQYEIVAPARNLNLENLQ